MEKHRADPDGRGRTREYTALELTVMLLKTLAASGDQRAYKALMALDVQHSPREPIGVPDRPREAYDGRVGGALLAEGRAATVL